MSDLKACPFCGRIPDVEDCGTNRYFIRCKCGIAQDKLYAQKCDAVRAWNKRKELRVKDTNVPITDTISRQAAIDELCDNCDNVKAVCAHYPCKQYIAIEQLPSAEPVRKEDLVNIVTCHEEIGYGKGFRDGYAQAVTEAKPVRMNGKWAEIGDEVFASIFKCSVCGQTAMADLYGKYQLSRYCPNCGAELSKGEENASNR